MRVPLKTRNLCQGKELKPRDLKWIEYSRLSTRRFSIFVWAPGAVPGLIRSTFLDILSHMGRDWVHPLDASRSVWPLYWVSV